MVPPGHLAEESRENLLAKSSGTSLHDSFDNYSSDDDASSTNSAIRLTTKTNSRLRPHSRKTKLNPSSRFVICRRPSKFCVLLSIVVVLSLLAAIGGGGIWVYRSSPKDGQSPPWYPSPRGGTVKSWQESYTKAKTMVEKMSLISKVNITSGVGWQMGLCVGNTGPANDVGFPSLCLQDGPLGIRFADQITAFPAGVTTGATWNRTLIHERGAAHGKEARRKGVHVLLGPAMGPLGRAPCGGRNWEGFGADPVLQGIAAAETIKGIQEQGVIATAKHFVAQEQEHFRQSFEWGLPNAMSANVDDRTMHEIYAWPFAESIRAGVGSIMCSYQMVNNSYTCGNSWLLNGMLKDELGFQGFVQSDWLAQRSGVASSLAGLDMSMPGDGKFWADGKSYFGSELTLAALNGSLPMERLDDMVTRIVAAWYQFGLDRWRDETQTPNFSSWTDKKVGKLYHGSNSNESDVVNHFIDAQKGNKESGEEHHSIIARRVAAEGTVLVKNTDSILPLSRQGHSVDAGKKYKVGVYGEDARQGNGPNVCVDRGCDEGTLAQGWGSGSVEFPFLVDPYSALETAFDREKVELSDHGRLRNEVTGNMKVEMSKQDLCIAFANADSGEGYISYEGIRGDRNDLKLQRGGEGLVKAVAQSCGGSVIVVIHSVGPVIVEEFVDLVKVKAIIFANLPGEESGNALMDVLFGEVDASGRLPYTVGKSLKDYGPGGQILYYANGVVPQVDFKEGLDIDYRHFDQAGIQPRYPFGFGLSYTTFERSNFVIKKLQEKSPLPDARPSALPVPTYQSQIPDPSTAIFPSGLRKIQKYVYPYINTVKEVKRGQYPYPEGYDTLRLPSAAGGAEGGNPSLYVPFVRVDFTIENTGTRVGQDVVQLYVSFPEGVTEPSTGDRIDFPKKVLRNFEKLKLQAKEKTKVSLELTRKDLSYWSVVEQNWVLPMNGEFKIWVGNSSADLELAGTF